MLRIHQVHDAGKSIASLQEVRDPQGHQRRRDSGDSGRYGLHITSFLFRGRASGKEPHRVLCMVPHRTRQYLDLATVNSTAYQGEAQGGTRVSEKVSGRKIVRAIRDEVVPFEQADHVPPIDEPELFTPRDATIPLTQMPASGHHLRLTDIRCGEQQLPHQVPFLNGITVDERYPGDRKRTEQGKQGTTRATHPNDRDMGRDSSIT